MRVSKMGVPDLKQVNLLTSVAGSVRGLHFSVVPQTKATIVLEGTALHILVPVAGFQNKQCNFEIRKLTPGMEASITPPLWANGIISLTDTVILYGSTTEYKASDEYCICLDGVCPDLTELYQSMCVGLPLIFSEKDLQGARNYP
jgi:dTDP-4-dehydrorhamnose 3,5-epimerase-like enzyme